MQARQLAESPIPVQRPERTDKGNDVIVKMSPDVSNIRLGPGRRNEKHSASQRIKKSHLLELWERAWERAWIHVMA